MLATSEPAPGSVIPRQKLVSRLKTPGSHCCFCAFVPWCITGGKPITFAPDRLDITPPSTREPSSVETSKWKTSSCRNGMPAGSGMSFGLYSGGTSVKAKPDFAHFSASSRGASNLDAHSNEYGNTFVLIYARSASRNSTCESL